MALSQPAITIFATRIHNDTVRLRNGLTRTRSNGWNALGIAKRPTVRDGRPPRKLQNRAFVQARGAPKECPRSRRAGLTADGKDALALQRMDRH